MELEAASLARYFHSGTGISKRNARSSVLSCTWLQIGLHGRPIAVGDPL
jgi:hypothetical protein